MPAGEIAKTLQSVQIATGLGGGLGICEASTAENLPRNRLDLKAVSCEPPAPLEQLARTYLTGCLAYKANISLAGGPVAQPTEVRQRQ